MKFKKLFSILSTLTIIVSIPFSASAASTLKGDANGDNKVDIVDAAYIAQHVAKRESIGTAGDYNGDGKTDIMDAADIAGYVASRYVTTKKSSSSVENEVLKLINQERAKVGVAPLTIDPTLNSMANIRAVEAVKSFSHTRLDGQSCFTIFDDFNMSYSYCGENLAAGNSTAAATVQQWVKSSGHYANIIDPNFTQVGIGYYYDESSPYKYYWTQIFRCP